MWSPHPVTMSYGEATEEDLNDIQAPVIIIGMIRTLPQNDEHNTATLNRYDFSQASPLRRIFSPVQQGNHLSFIKFGDNTTFQEGFVANWFSQFELFLSQMKFKSVRLSLQIDDEGYRGVPELNVFYHCGEYPYLDEPRRIDRWVFENPWFPSPGERIFP